MSNKVYDNLDYYKILEISFDTPDDVLRQKYRELVKFWHPDHNEDPRAVDMFQRISVAYDVLKDAKSKLKYTLLSMIYDKANFPDMNALSLIRNMHGQEDINLRAFHLTEITGKVLLHSSIDKIYYCSPSEAPGVIKNISKHNWTQGFLGVTSIFANIKAIVQNITRLNSKKENLQLLLHNSMVYEDEGKTNEAATLATLAKEYASKDEQLYIDNYLEMLGQVSLLGVKKWNYSKLLRVQLFYPFVIFLAFSLALGVWSLNSARSNLNNDTKVKEVVIYKNGQKAYSDVAVAKIFNIPVDVYDTQKLYHTTEKTSAMHGADKSFDVFKVVEEGTTVRVTGYTADKKWLRVMFDNGEMAFIEANKLQQGIGNEIPLWSKIYKEN